MRLPIIFLVLVLGASPAWGREAVKVEADFLPGLEKSVKEAQGDEAKTVQEMLTTAKAMIDTNSIPEPSAKVSEKISKLAASATGAARYGAVTELAKEGEAALPALSAIVQSTDADAAVDAALAIAAVKSKLGTLALVQALMKGPGKVRCAAAQALKELTDERAIPFLQYTETQMEKWTEQPATERVKDDDLYNLWSECYEAREAIVKANLPPGTMKLQQKFEEIKEKYYALDEEVQREPDEVVFKKYAKAVKKLLPEVEAIAAALPKDETAQELLASVRLAIAHDGVPGYANDEMYNSEDLKRLAAAGIRAVAWVEKGNLRVGVVNFGKPQEVCVLLGYKTGTRGAGGKDDRLVEFASAKSELGTNEVRLVHFNGIPKPPKQDREQWVDENPRCQVSAGSGPKPVMSEIYVQELDGREHVVQGDEVTFQMCGEAQPDHNALYHIPNHFVTQTGDKVQCRVAPGKGIWQAENGWFVDNVTATVTVTLKDVKRPVFLEVPSIFIRFRSPDFNGYMEVDSIRQGPALIAVSAATDIKVVDVDLKAEDRFDSKPLSDKPEERAKELAARLKEKGFPWNTAAETADELARLGDIAVPLLVQLIMTDTDYEVERVIERTVAKYKNPQVISGLLSQLGSDDWQKRRKAIVALTEIGDTVVKALLDVIKGDNPRARASALMSLEGIARRHASDEITEVAVSCLGDPEKDVRESAIGVLASIGDPKTIPNVTKCLNDPIKNVRTSAADALGRMKGSGVIGPLLKKLEDGAVPEDEKSRIISALGEQGATEATPACARLLLTCSPRLRHDLLWAMLKFADERAADALISQFDDPDSKVRWAAARVLGRTGAQKAVDPLVELLGDNDETVRAYAAESLIALGLKVEESGRYRYDLPKIPRDVIQAAGKKTSEELVENLGAGDWSVRQAAREEMRKRGDAAFPQLRNALTSPSAQIRANAVVLLSAMKDTQALDSVAPLLGDEDVRVRRKAAAFLSQHNDPRFKDAWNKALESSDWFVREKASGALTQTADEKSIPELRKLLFDPRKETRINAISALGRLRDLEAVPLLVELLWHQTERTRGLDDYDDWKGVTGGQVLAIRDALIAIGPPAVQHVLPLVDCGWSASGVAQSIIEGIGDAAKPELIRAVDSTNQGIARSAAEMLAKLGYEGMPSIYFGMVEKRWGGESELVKLGRAVIPVARKYLEEGTERQKLSAAYVLAKLDDRSGVQLLLNALGSGDRAVRTSAGFRIEEVATAAEVPALIEALKDPGCPVSVVIALGKLGDKRAVPVLKGLLFQVRSEMGRFSAEALFKLTGEKHTYLDGRGCVQVWGTEDPKAPTAVEAGLVGGKPTFKFDFEDGTTMGWKLCRATASPAVGKAAVEALPATDRVRLISPKMSYVIGEDSWLDLRFHVPKKLILVVELRTDKGRTFFRGGTFEPGDWRGYACPLADMRDITDKGPASKVGDIVQYIRITNFGKQDMDVLF